MNHPDDSLELKPGSRVLIRRTHPHRGKPIEACVERVDDELLWLEGADTAFEPGERIWLDVSVASDARYRAAFEVEVASDAHIAVGREGDPGEWKWARVQQRSLVRVETPDLNVQIRPCESPGSSDSDAASAPAAETYRVIDLSAGGMCIAASGLEADQEVICEFELPDQTPYTIESRVVRVEHDQASLMFSDASEYACSKILRWIFREQVRQHQRALGPAERRKNADG